MATETLLCSTESFISREVRALDFSQAVGLTTQELELVCRLSLRGHLQVCRSALVMCPLFCSIAIPFLKCFLKGKYK